MRPRYSVPKATSRAISLPAPIGGLNARDGIGEMPATDAVTLTNWFPTPSTVNLRNGSVSYATGLTGAVETLAMYGGLTSSKFFAAANGGIYDISTAGAVGAPVASGFTSNRWQTLNFGSTAALGEFLLMFNGADTPQIYNGSAWANTTFTGVTQSLLVQATGFKQRIYIVEKDSFRCWYGGVNAVAGALTSLDFGGMFKLGGYLMAVASWSVDSSAGPQELFVAVSSLGEVVVYQGYDPSSAANWSIASHFRIGRPIGRRCFAKIGSDLVFLTADGAFPLSKAMLTDRSQENDAVSTKIQNLINADVQSYSANFGWQIILYPIGNKVIINVPGVSSNYQYVMNTITGAWCKFTGWNASCWELYNDALYYGGAGTVYQADVGYNDNGAAISCEALQAFNYFGEPAQKLFTMMRPVIYGTQGITPSCSMNVDFDTVSAPQVTTTTTGGITLWGSPWGSPWSSPSGTVRAWHGAGAIGYSAAPHIAMSVKNTVMQWQSTDVTYQCGGTL